MNLIQAEIAINKLLAEYSGLIDGADITIDRTDISIDESRHSIDQNKERTPATVDLDNIRFPNQIENGSPFIPPIDKPWCRISIDYHSTQFSGFGNRAKFRDFGMISIQCFVPRNTGTLVLMRVCQEWRDLLEGKSIEHLEIYMVHAPQNIDDDNFYGKIMRAEFRVN